MELLLSWKKESLGFALYKANKKVNYYMLNSIINGDSIEILKQLEDNSIDSCITDVPYGLSLMGKDWDKSVPQVDILSEILRVLKPGAFFVTTFTPRQDLMARFLCNLQDAGFVINFTSIYWTYNSGMPKCNNLGPMIDKKLGKERERIQSNTLLDNFATRLPGHQERVHKNTKPGVNSTTDLGAQYDGAFAGFNPKPAVEPIIVCMKPLSEKSYIAQAMTSGKGVSWFKDCRIPYADEKDAGLAKADKGFKQEHGDVVQVGKNYDHDYCRNGNRVMKMRFKPTNIVMGEGTTFDDYNTREEFVASSEGRFAANLLVSDEMLQESSKYYDLDRWFAQNLSELPEKLQQTYPYLDVPKPAKGEKEKGLEGMNKHLSIKPVKLFSYLVTLFTRPGDVVLEPYCGSGTTAIACKLLDRNFIAIEREEEYFEIAVKRVNAW